MIDFFITLACYTLALFLFYERVESYFASTAKEVIGYSEDEEKDEKDNIENMVEEELRADTELERKHRLTRIRKRLLPADTPS